MEYLIGIVGGIYTVIKTKVPVTVEEYGDRYCLIGPLSRKNSSFEVEVCEPECHVIGKSLKEMRDAGVRVVYGKWLIDGSPSVILFDVESVLHRLQEWKGDLWKLAGIPSPSNDLEMNGAILLGYLAAWFIGLVSFDGSLILNFAVLVLRETPRSGCNHSLSRVAIIGWLSFKQEERHSGFYYFYHPRNSAGTVFVCW